MLIQRFFTINKALSTIEQVQIIDKKEFITTILDKNSQTILMHINIENQEKMARHFKKKIQIRAKT